MTSQRKDAKTQRRKAGKGKMFIPFHGSWQAVSGAAFTKAWRIGIPLLCVSASSRLCVKKKTGAAR